MNDIKYVIEQAEYYGYSGNRVKGFDLCSRIEKQIDYQRNLMNMVWRTLALSSRFRRSSKRCD